MSHPHPRIPRCSLPVIALHVDRNQHPHPFLYTHLRPMSHHYLSIRSVSLLFCFATTHRAANINLSHHSRTPCAKLTHLSHLTQFSHHSHPLTPRRTAPLSRSLFAGSGSHGHLHRPSHPASQGGSSGVEATRVDAEARLPRVGPIHPCKWSVLCCLCIDY